MFVAKQVADLITFARALIGFGLALLGFTHGPAGLPLVVWTMILNWTGDSLDGPIARRSRVSYQTWIGEHDLQVDMLVSAGLLVYMIASGFWSPWLACAYLLAWLLVFWRWGVPPALGMLFQAPIYGWFILVAIRDVPEAGLWLVIWVAAAVALTWPRFPRIIVPNFLEGMREIWSRSRQNRK